MELISVMKELNRLNRMDEIIPFQPNPFESNLKEIDVLSIFNNFYKLLCIFNNNISFLFINHSFFIFMSSFYYTYFVLYFLYFSFHII